MKRAAYTAHCQIGTLLVVFLACLVWIGSAKVQTGGATPHLKVVGKIKNGELLLDEEVLKYGGGSIQKILDWIPPNTKLSVTISNFHVEEPLSINKPVHITSEDKLMRITCHGMHIKSGGVTIGGFQIKGCKRRSPKGIIHVTYAKRVLLKEISCISSSNTGGPACVSVLSSSVTLENMKGVDNFSGADGGFMFASESTVTMKGCRFENNVGRNGGVVRTESGKLTVLYSTFASNKAKFSGGAIYGKGAGFEVVGSTFSKNIAVGKDGGGAYFEGATITLSKTRFLGNEARNYGGGFIAYGNVRISYSRFAGNKAVKYGGGGARWQGITATIFHVVFEANNAGREGGGISADGNTKIVKSKFYANKAIEIFGGGAYLRGETLEVTKTIFKTNYGGVEGGAIYALGKIKVTESQFHSNSAALRAGGLYALGIVTVSGSHFNENRADSRAGAIFAMGRHTEISSSSFTSNRASDDSGGGVHAEGYVIKVSDCQFKSNRAGNYGGGLYSFGQTDISGSTFIENLSDDTDGGGVYCQGETLNVTESLFDRNRATGSGGGIWALGNFELSHSQFLGNLASRYEGGGVFAKGPMLTVSSSVFKKNKADEDGGGISATTAFLTVSGSTFEENTGGTAGGALFTDGLSMTVSMSTFRTNTAKSGGGILTQSGKRSISTTTNTFTNSPVVPPLSSFTGLRELHMDSVPATT